MSFSGAWSCVCQRKTAATNSVTTSVKQEYFAKLACNDILHCEGASLQIFYANPTK